MMDIFRTRLIVISKVLIAMSITGGCRKDEPKNLAESVATTSTIKTKTALGPEDSPIKPSLEQGWCGGHGVPESVCTRCNGSLTEEFKTAGDWCREHELPESQCFVCRPELEARWKKLDPSATPQDHDSDSGSTGPSPGINGTGEQIGGEWCSEHGVPESICTRCHHGLIAGFKSANDWCGEHGLPESQCTICNPEVRDEFAAMRPDSGSSPEESVRDLLLERSPRLLTGTSDPLCQVDKVRVRFLDASIVRKAGIEVERVQRRAISATIEVPAEVEFDATRLTRITPLVSGIIREVPVELGTQVNVSDLLAVVDSPVLGEAKSLFIERTQNLKLAESDLTRVNTIHRGAKRMLEVCTPEAKPDAIRNVLTELPVGAAKARLLRAHATLQLARLEAARIGTLHNKKINSEREFQAAQSALVAAEADFVAMREEVGFNIEQALLSAMRAVEVAKSALESADRRLQILGLSREQVAAIGTESNEALSRFEIRSPVYGRVIERAISVGESVDVEDVLFVVVDTSNMWLIANVYERDLRQLRRGLPAHFTVDGMPGSGFEGRVSWISSQLDDRTRTVRLRADLPNPDGLLRAKMFGQARIVIHDNEQVVGVSAAAVQTDGCCQLVFVEESETVFQPQKVVLGSRANGFVEVLKGVEEGDFVASAGSFLMKTEILKSSIGAGCCEVDPGR